MGENQKMKNKIVTIVLSVILFVVPVLIMPDIWENYNVPKIIVLLICGLILLIGILICWFAPNSREIMEKFKINKKTAIIAAILMFLCLINMNKVVQFLYFQF